MKKLSVDYFYNCKPDLHCYIDMNYVHTYQLFTIIFDALDLLIIFMEQKKKLYALYELQEDSNGDRKVKGVLIPKCIFGSIS